MIRKPKIKSIIFDLGGVVTHGGYLGFINKYCFECLTSFGRKKILELERQVNLGEISEKTFYFLINKVFNVEVSPEQIHKLIIKGMQTDKELVHMIPHLKKAKIVLFTNSIGQLALEVLRKRKLKKIFDNVFISTKIHMVKPDKKAYEYVLKKLKVRPKEVIMVDDRIVNLLPAQALGMNVIRYKNAKQFAKELKKYELV